MKKKLIEGFVGKLFYVLVTWLVEDRFSSFQRRVLGFLFVFFLGNLLKARFLFLAR